MISQSTSIKLIAAALLVVQAKLEHVKKQADNPYFKSKYADINSVLDAVTKPLNDVGVILLQFPDSGGHADTLYLTTRLLHAESGEFLEATASVPLAKADPQGFGAAMTYARRYGVQAVMGLQAVDDDAESAVDHGSKAPLPATKPAAKPGGFKLGAGAKKATSKAAAPSRGKTGVFPKTDVDGGKGGDE